MVVPGVPAFAFLLVDGTATFFLPLGFGDCWPERKNVSLAPPDSSFAEIGAKVLLLLLLFPNDNLLFDMFNCIIIIGIFLIDYGYYICVFSFWIIIRTIYMLLFSIQTMRDKNVIYIIYN